MGKKSGGGEAAAARRDEEKRQAQIREGTKRINTIFDGGTYATGALGTDAVYDPTKTYYKADGTAWVPPSSPSSMFDGSTAFPGVPGLPGQSNKAAEAFAKALKNGELYSGVETSSGFGEDFFNGRKQAFLDYASPQLEDQYGDAQKQLTFALARNGTLDSSIRGEKVGELQKKYDLNKQQIADQALASSTDARNAVEDARANLIATLNATGDAKGAAQAALARSAALSKPAAYSPLTNLFADFTATLGQQAALERANYYSGGQTGSRYSTGLFAPSTGAVKVS